ncbi:hypothetical protein H8E77_09895 [bacterium]|nr:hypothetical protein [bacterium]
MQSKRFFPADIAREVGVSPGFIRNLVDAGKIRMRKDLHGWRWTDEPVKVIQKVRELLNEGSEFSGQ